MQSKEVRLIAGPIWAGLDKSISRIVSLSVRLKKPFSNIGIGCLAALILFSSSGIHNLQHNHFLPWTNLPASQDHITAKSTLKNPGTAHCTACFFNRLLNQCVFPASEKLVLTEFFCEKIDLFQETFSTPILGNAETRGPPA
jgi:hypothetical protein